MARDISKKGADFIASFEKEVLHVYDDGYSYPTAGIGHRVNLPIGSKITKEQSRTWWAQDLAKYGGAVNDAVKVHVSQNQFDMLTSLCFNIGIGAFKNSSIVRKLNRGDYAGAADGLLAWNKSAGKVSKGLVRRRKAERAIFLTPDPPSSTAVPPVPDSQSPPIVQTSSPGAQADPDDTAKTQSSNTDSTAIEQTTVETSGGESAVSTKTTLLEDKTMEAPPSDATGTAAVKTTFLGITVPACLVGAFTAAQQAISQGFINAADVGAAVLGFLRSNAKYIAIVVAIFIAYRIVRKVVRHTTFWIQMLTVANPNWHTVKVTPAPPNDGKWYEFWK